MLTPMITNVEKTKTKSQLQQKLTSINNFVRQRSELAPRAASGQKLTKAETDVLEAFQGLEYPSPDELQHITLMIDFIRDHLLIVDARDAVSSKLKKDMTPVSELRMYALEKMSKGDD